MNHSVRPGSLAYVVGAGLLGVALLSAPAMADSGASAAKSNGAAVTVTDPTLLTRSGFLSNYDRLKKTDWGNGVECWRDENMDAKQYDKAMISRVAQAQRRQGNPRRSVRPEQADRLFP